MLLLSQAWRHRALLLAFALVFMCALAKRLHEKTLRQSKDIATLEAINKAKPTSEESVAKVQEKTKVRGKIKTTNTYAPPSPGSCEPILVAQVVEEEPTTETTKTESVSQRDETPVKIALPVADRLRWVVGLSLNAGDIKQLPVARAGLMGENVGLTYGYATFRADGRSHHLHMVEPFIRF